VRDSVQLQRLYGSVNWKNRELWKKQKRNNGALTVAKRLYSIAAGTLPTVITHAR